MNLARVRALDRWQGALRDVLTGYVNGEYVRRSARWTHPLFYGLSVFSVRKGLRKIARASCALEANSNERGTSLFRHPLDAAMVQCQDAPEEALVYTLTEGYKLLRSLIDAEQRPLRSEEIPVSREFSPAEYEARGACYFGPVMALARFIRGQMAPYLDMAILQGSVADMGLSKGYSDLDTFLVLNEATVTHPSRLRRFARLCYRSLGALYRFDPLQHHGHIVATSIDMGYCPEYWLPLPALSDSKLIHRSSDLRAEVRGCLPEARAVFEQSVDGLQRRAGAERSLADPYAFKCLLSGLMLLPARYLQARGVFCTKKDSFALARSYLSGVDWAVLDEATTCRRNWPDTRNRWADSLTSVASHFSPHVVKRIQRAALGSAPQEHIKQYAAGMNERAAKLAVEMHARFWADEASLTPKRAPCSGAPLTILDHPRQRSVSAYDETRARYLNQVSAAPGASALYEYGDVGVPGLSDLDFVVAVSEGASQVDPHALSIQGLSFCHRDLVLHEPLVVPVSLIGDLKRFLPFANPRRLWNRDSGEGLEVRELDAQSAAFAQTAGLIEKLFSYQIWLQRTLSRGAVDARWSIAVLNSIRYSVSALASVTGHTTLGEDSGYVEAVSRLRASWFEERSLHRRNVALRHLFSDARCVLHHLIRSLVAFLSGSGWLMTGHGLPLPEEIACPHRSTRLVFTAEWEQEGGHVAEPQEQREGLHLPYLFLRVFGLYSRSEHLSKALALRGPAIPAVFLSAPKTEFEEHVSTRAGLLGHQTQFLRRHHFRYGGFLPLGWIEL